MGLAATGSEKLSKDVARATAQELAACGINWIMGPVLDVLQNARSQPLGTRALGDDPQEVSKYGVELIKGYKDAGLATCGKHFPSYGNLEFGSLTDVPTIKESIDQLNISALVPFKSAIGEGIDAMMVGGVAMSSAGMNVMHACLSDQIVDGLLRRDLKFNGVVVSECLEMEALSHNIGIGGGTVMAVKAGCDIVLLCRSFLVQQEAISGLKLGFENGMIDKTSIQRSLKRVLQMKSRSTSWETALHPGGLDRLTKLQPSHTMLSTKAYNNSITLVRDRNNLLPLSNTLEPDEELLVLSPLVKPLPASAASHLLAENGSVDSPEPVTWGRSASIMSGESVFREFGRSLARQRSARVTHTSYTANGVRPVHEDLIARAGAVIVLTADANRNLYQYGFAKHVSLICNSQYTSAGEKREKPLIVVSVSSPYDFVLDPAIGTYLCTYDFTETALQALVKVLFGEIVPEGSLPGTISQNQKSGQSRQHWLVEAFNEERDSHALEDLLTLMHEDAKACHLRSELSAASSNTFLLRNPDVEEAHFVVRNSGTQALYGFCSTYFFRSTGTGVIGSLIVDPNRRKLSIGHSMHNRAIRTLLQRKGVRSFQLGSRLPNLYLGIPTNSQAERKRLRQWFANMGWNVALSRPVCSMILRNLSTWMPPPGLIESMHNVPMTFDMVFGQDHADSIGDHLKTNTRQGVQELYKIAMADSASCGIIRAKRSQDGAILGTVVVYNENSALAGFVPALRDCSGAGESAGGISSPVVSPSAGEYTTLIQGLILLGIRQFKKQKAGAVILDFVSLINNHGPTWMPRIFSFFVAGSVITADNLRARLIVIVATIAFPRSVSLCSIASRK